MRTRNNVIGELMISLRYERVDEPLSCRTLRLIAELDDFDGGSVTRVLKAWKPVGAVATPR